MWGASRLPEIDLTEHGLRGDAARTAAFRVRGEEETPIYTNRADENGLISGMPCPSVAPGTTVDVEVGEQTIRVTTV